MNSDVLTFFNESFHYHSDFYRDKNRKHAFYVVEIHGTGMRYDIIDRLKQKMGYKRLETTSSTSIDSIYVKINGQTMKRETYFPTTQPLFLQQGIRLEGYSLSEVPVSIHENEWGDDDSVDRKDNIRFTRPVVEDCHIFSSDNSLITISDNKMVIRYKEIDSNTLLSVVQMLLLEIFIGYIYILSAAEEQEVKSMNLVKIMKKTQQIFSYETFSAKIPEKSILVPDYFFTLPCLRFSVKNSVFLLDSYDNLRKIEETETDTEEVIEEGFMYPDATFFSVSNEYADDHVAIDSKDAVVYHSTRGYGVYTLASNLYIDKIVNDTFTRISNAPHKHTTTKWLYFSKRAMKSTQVTAFKQLAREYKMKQIVIRFCNDFDVDYLLRLPDSLKKTILDTCRDITSQRQNWIADFFTRILTYRYDESTPIICNLDENNGRSVNVIERPPLLLDETLGKEKLEFCIFGKDKKKKEFLDAVMKIFDQFKFYSKDLEKRVHVRGSITNAWMKCWEMVNNFQLVPIQHSSSFTIFCNAEFPGAFLLALNHYIKTHTSNKKYEWYANSIWPTEELKTNKDVFKDSFKLYEKYPQRWLMTPENGGDCTDPKMIDVIDKKLSNKVDLYMSDISMGFETEDAEARNNLGQIICGLKTLKNGGTMVCKMFMFFKPFTMSLLRLLSRMFKSFVVTKPMASRPTSSEVYIIGKEYTRQTDSIERLEHVLGHLDVDTYFEPVTEDFYAKLVYASFYIYDRQLRFLKNTLEITRTLYEKNKDPKSVSIHSIQQAGYSQELELRKSIVEHWKTMFKVPYLPKEDDL